MWTKNGHPVKSYSKQVKAGAVALRQLLATSHLRLHDEYIEAAIVFTDPHCRVSVRRSGVAVLRLSELLPFITALSDRRQMSHARADIIASALAASCKAQ